MRRSRSLPLELDAVLARIPALTGPELRTLADLWLNSPLAAKARSRALEPGTPLVLETLRIFDDLAQLFADEMDSPVVATALKAIRDGVAGIIARPILSRRESDALESPLRTALSSGGCPVFVTVTPPVSSFLAAVEGLSARCHDPVAAAAFERILVGAISCDRADHAAAVDTGFRAAVDSSRHRVWSLVRISAERGLGRRCRTCPPSLGFDDYDRERVTALCADAACALLVADLVPARSLDLLLEPLSGLVAFPRPPLGA